MSFTSTQRSERHVSDDSFAFKTIFLLAFGLLFMVAMFARLGGMNWRELLPGAESASSMGQGVKAAVYTFMNHII
jgi:light-harvesting complex 1 beta chain